MRRWIPAAVLFTLLLAGCGDEVFEIQVNIRENIGEIPCLMPPPVEPGPVEPTEPTPEPTPEPPEPPPEVVEEPFPDPFPEQPNQYRIVLMRMNEELETCLECSTGNCPIEREHCKCVDELPEQEDVIAGALSGLRIDLPPGDEKYCLVIESSVTPPTPIATCNCEEVMPSLCSISFEPFSPTNSTEITLETQCASEVPICNDR